MRSLALALAATSAFAGIPPSGVFPDQERYSRPAQLVRLPDGREMNLDCRGSGSPTVLLDAGWDGWSLAWRKVHEPLAKITRTCAFDRAGLGFSDPGPLPRDASADVNDEWVLTQAARVPGPYILVGHSMSGLNVMLFAYRHTLQVAGIVLLDPTFVNNSQQEAAADSNGPAVDKTIFAALKACVRDSRSGATHPADPGPIPCVDPPHKDWSDALNAAVTRIASRPSYQEARLSALQSESTSSNAELLAEAKPLGDLPLIVLTADQGMDPAIPLATRLKLEHIRDAGHLALSHASTQGSRRLVNNSGHFIARDRPDVVIDAVTQVVTAARARGEFSLR